MKHYFVPALVSALAITSIMPVSAAIPAGWSVDAHSSATVNFGAHDEISINSPTNVHAHVEKDISETSPFRVSAAIKAPEVADWAPLASWFSWGLFVTAPILQG